MRKIIIPALLALLLILNIGTSAAFAAEVQERITKEFTYDIQSGEGEYEKEDIFDASIKEDEKEYVLTDIAYKVDKKEAVRGEDIVQAVTHNEEYANPQDGFNPPSELSISEVNKETNKSEIVKVKLQDYKETGRIKEEKDIPVTYHDYGAPLYEFAGTLIPHREDKPALAGYERAILLDAGYDPEEWTITDINYVGAAYVSGGEAKRDAIAKGVREVPVFTATYTGEIRNISYLDDTYDYTVTATGIYELVDTGLTPIQKMMIAIGVVAAIAALVLILFVIARKKKKKEI